jgi:hydroxyethylthiazole kinase-like uncharacterized protein yjeF
MAELMWIINSAESKEVDQRTVLETSLTTQDLILRAGGCLLKAVREMAPPESRITIFCGKGNNGADGLILGKVALEAGFMVECLLVYPESELGSDCKESLKIAVQAGVNVTPFSSPQGRALAECAACSSLVVDAVLGTGARGAVEGVTLEAIESINRTGAPVLCVDVPSGIVADTGEDCTASVWATRTVVMGLPKPYLFQGLGMTHAGDWNVADIGYPCDLMRIPREARMMDRHWIAGLLPERAKGNHKTENGRLLVVAGSHTMPGAAVLAAKGALRSGAGVVTVAGVPTVCQAIAAHLPEVILLPLPAMENGECDPDAADIIFAAQSRFDAALFGPGLAPGLATSTMLGRLWADWEIPSTIDATALNVAAGGVALPAVPCALTPHPGELGRLLNRTTAEINTFRLGSVQAAVKKYGKTCLLKGPHTIIGDAQEPLNVNPTGNPGMATAGMGDVLAGMVASLMGQQLPPYYATSVAVYWHGFAADMIAESSGAIGMRASDVATQLPKARAKITATCTE